MKRALSSAIAAGLVLLTIGVGVVSLSLGKIVKTAVEAAGPRVLGAPVELGLVTISPWSGRGILRGLVIGNPAGFKSAHAASVASVEVEVRLRSLLTNTIVVERVAVREPELIWEIGPGGSNLKKLQGNAEASAAKYGGSKEGASAPAASAGSKRKSLLIREFSVTGGRVGLSATAFGGQGLTAPLPDVRLTDLGGQGHSPADVASQALRAVTSSAQGAVSNIGGKTLDQVRSVLSSFFRKSGK
ncbi:MAG: hypothetical protein ACHQ2Z_10775 [Elusimicrobiota bacterium]